MLRVENISTWGVSGAIRGMRNPMNSWSRSDTVFTVDNEAVFRLGGNDLDLMKRLYKAGPEHRKYLRMIHIQMDVTAPLYWWKEYDTYKVATASNSCSTMHKVHSKKLTQEDFSIEHLGHVSLSAMSAIIDLLNENREQYLRTNDKRYWWQMIQLLPESYNQKRTIDINYETALSIIHQRRGHKLDEWAEFVGELERLPFVKEILEDD
ncbi:MAG: hypothetical protein KBS66_07485 [Eubacterium sp.]|nr:hypothetical protein [Candidatus Colimonas fimequi]